MRPNTLSNTIQMTPLPISLRMRLTLRVYLDGEGSVTSEPGAIIKAVSSDLSCKAMTHTLNSSSSNEAMMSGSFLANHLLLMQEIKH
jgi:hypothetical protein